MDYVDTDDWWIRRAGQIKYFSSSISIYFPKQRENSDKESFYRVSQKKGGLVFWAQFMGLNGLKSKSGRKQNPTKI